MDCWWMSPSWHLQNVESGLESLYKSGGGRRPVSLDSQDDLIRSHPLLHKDCAVHELDLFPFPRDEDDVEFAGLNALSGFLGVQEPSC